MIKLSSCPKRVTLTLSLAPPPSEEKELSVHCAIVGFVELVEGEIHSVCGDGLSVQRVGSLENTQGKRTCVFIHSHTHTQGQRPFLGQSPRRAAGKLAGGGDGPVL